MTYQQDINKLIHTSFKDCLKFESSFVVARHQVKKNRRKIMVNRKTGNRFIGKTQELHSAENNYILNLYKSLQQRGDLRPLTQDLWMIAIFEFKKSDLMTLTGVRKKTTPNLSNLYQIVEDCLQVAKYSKRGKLISKGAGVILDDDQIQSHDWSRIIVGDETKLHLYLLDYEQAEERLRSTRQT